VRHDPFRSCPCAKFKTSPLNRKKNRRSAPTASAVCLGAWRAKPDKLLMPFGRILQVRLEHADAGEVAGTVRRNPGRSRPRTGRESKNRRKSLQNPPPAGLSCPAAQQVFTDAGLSFLIKIDHGRKRLARYREHRRAGARGGWRCRSSGCARSPACERAGLVAVAGDADAVESDGLPDFPQQIGGEQQRTVDDGNGGDLLSAEGRANLGSSVRTRRRIMLSETMISSRSW